MKENSFKEVIADIIELCKKEVKETKEVNKNGNDKKTNEFKVEDWIINASEIEYFKNEDFYRKDLEKYFHTLSDKTINFICALMNFGQEYSSRALPINLNKLFSEVYLPYWTDMNGYRDKKDIIDYLLSKKNLDQYLNRANDILFSFKGNNIEFKCTCGGFLYLPDSSCIELYNPCGDYNKYALHLKCFSCENETVEYVDEKFLEDKSI